MAYTKTNWVNDSTPAINATNLNKIEQGIYDNSLSSIYSTSEIVVGTWLDKPKYRKILRFNPRTDNLETTFNHSIANIKEILPTSSCVLHRTNNRYVFFGMGYPADALKEWSIGWQATPTYIQTWVGESMRQQIDTTNYGAVAVLEYTKTTD